jgi:hypothetical protein
MSGGCGGTSANVLATFPINAMSSLRKRASLAACQNKAKKSKKQITICKTENIATSYLFRRHPGISRSLLPLKY